ncbi:2578_t:CDS:1, partial [Paraglomus occultum]
APVTTSQAITSAEIEKLSSKIASLEEKLSQPTQIHPQIPQKNEALEHLYILAQRLGCPQEMLNQKNASTLNGYVTEELTRRLGVVEAYMAKVSAVRPKKEPFPDPQIY